MVVQPGEDGPEGVVVQRLRRRLGASSRADASAALGDRAPAPAPTAARLHGWCTAALGDRAPALYLFPAGWRPDQRGLVDRTAGGWSRRFEASAVLYWALAGSGDFSRSPVGPVLNIL